MEEYKKIDFTITDVIRLDKHVNTTMNLPTRFEYKIETSQHLKQDDEIYIKKDSIADQNQMISNLKKELYVLTKEYLKEKDLKEKRVKAKHLNILIQSIQTIRDEKTQSIL